QSPGRQHTTTGAGGAFFPLAAGSESSDPQSTGSGTGNRQAGPGQGPQPGGPTGAHTGTGKHTGSRQRAAKPERRSRAPATIGNPAPEPGKADPGRTGRAENPQYRHAKSASRGLST